ncbi:MAG: hypothetical protein WBV46_04450 [Terriglobales bacterium]
MPNVRGSSLKLLSVIAVVVLLASSVIAQTTTPLKHQPPDGVQLTFQMTDGTVLGQGYGDQDWWKLTPDNTGSYVNGTWTQVASLATNYAPEAFASAVLADGTLLITGGEYNFGNFTLTNLGAIYNPVTNVWTNLEAPKGWKYIGDSPSSVLANGDFLIGNKLTKQDRVYTPSTGIWSTVGDAKKSDFDAEEGWTLLADGNILTADVLNAPNSEIYNTTKHKWSTAGSTIVDLHSPSPFGCINYGPKGKLCYYPPGEIGPQILRPDGTVIVFGSYTASGNQAGNTAYYNSLQGGWTKGPQFPNSDNAGDSFAALLPNGDVLVEGDSGQGYIWNGSTLTETSYTPGSLMVLPTGQILVGGGTTEVYNPSGTYEAAWQPTITSCPTTVTPGTTYEISGTQFNGLSQANAFGDEYQTATNYPLVRITNNATGNVVYAKTHGHSSMGVATGSATVSTNFDVPSTIGTGASTLVVVANGIPSAGYAITVQ